jgi:PAS domain S-box-containing protein
MNINEGYKELDFGDLLSSETKYQMLFNKANDSIFVYHLNKKGEYKSFVEVNDMACEKLKYTREELLSMSIYDIIPLRLHKNIKKFLQDVFNNKPNSNIINTIRVNRDGIEIPFEVNVHLFELNGKPTILSIARDISDRIKSETERREAQKLIQKTANLASVGVITGGITHEINQPLNVIKMGADGILYWDTQNPNILPGRIVTMIQSIADSSRRIESIIKHMRSFWIDSKNDSLAEINLNHSIIKAISLVKQKLQSHEIKLEKEFDENDLLVLADAVKLELSINNLINNAIYSLDQTKSNDKKIFVKTYSKDDYAFFEIADNGIGLPDIDNDKLFDPFFSTKQVDGGTGLGLAIVKMFIERFGGKIDVVKNSKYNAAFIIKLKLFNRENNG